MRVLLAECRWLESAHTPQKLGDLQLPLDIAGKAGPGLTSTCGWYQP